MKPIVVTLHLQCRDDVPANVLDWMAENLAEHAEHEFGCDYEPEFTGYEGPTLLDAAVEAHAALDADVLDNGRVWRQRGAPPSSVTKHDPTTTEPAITPET